MSDQVAPGVGWRRSPAAYLDERPAEFRIARPKSCYVKMRDGCRLAADVYLPERAENGTAPPDRCPTILILTPYYRRFKVRPGALETAEPSPNAGKYRDFFVSRGYAVVVVDVRGTGASFGTRDSFRSPKERDDYREVADWIVAQPWSDRRIGATGISYVGAACDFLASTGHPAVKAIAPISSVWDTYSDHYYPGGMLLNRLAVTYDELMVALDHDRRDLLQKFAYFKDPNLEGPQPVDEDPDGSLCRAAVAEHLGNFHMPDFITEFRFRDDTLPYDPDFDSGSFSPYRYADSIDLDVAVYSISGWMDGAGYMNGAIARFLTLPNRKQHLLLGPWDHGARINASPWREQPEAQFPLMGEILRFFDHYLAGRDTGLEEEEPVHFFSLAKEEWESAAEWPPTSGNRSLFLGQDGGLETQPGAAGRDEHQVSFAFGTGAQTRYGRLAALDVREYYADWDERDRALLYYTTAPLEHGGDLCGHPVVSLWIDSDQPDAALHVYLETVEPDGRTRHVTEGVLRALHRRESPCPAYHRTSWPWRSFTRADAEPLLPGRPALLRFALLPTAWRFKAGQRIRLAIAGCDRDHYGQVPHGRPPLLGILRGGEHASVLELPWRA